MVPPYMVLDTCMVMDACMVWNAYIVLDKYNEEDNEESVSTLIQKYITDQEDEESVWKMSVVTCCDWSMDTSGGSAESRLAVVQNFLNVLNTSHSVSVYVLNWIKAKSECRVNPCIDLLSRLLVELLWSKVITLSQPELRSQRSSHRRLAARPREVAREAAWMRFLLA